MEEMMDRSSMVILSFVHYSAHASLPVTPFQDH